MSTEKQDRSIPNLVWLVLVLLLCVLLFAAKAEAAGTELGTDQLRIEAPDGRWH
jgi:hypothetical protein